MKSGDIIIPSNVTIEVIKGVDKGKVFQIENKTVTIGRSKACDIQLSDEFVSNKHCQIVFRNDHFTAIDLGSLNKTKVNDTIYIQKNLKNNDVLSLGKTQIRFLWEKADENQSDPEEDILYENGEETDVYEENE